MQDKFLFDGSFMVTDILFILLVCTMYVNVTQTHDQIAVSQQ